MTSKVDGAAYGHQEVDEDWSDSNEPDVPWIAEGEGLISSILRIVERTVAYVTGTDIVLPIGIAEEEVSFDFFQRAPLGRREVAEDSKLVLKGDRVQGAGAVWGIWLASLTVKI